MATPDPATPATAAPATAHVPTPVPVPATDHVPTPDPAPPSPVLVPATPALGPIPAAKAQAPTRALAARATIPADQVRRTAPTAGANPMTLQVPARPAVTIPTIMQVPQMSSAPINRPVIRRGARSVTGRHQALVLATRPAPGRSGRNADASLILIPTLSIGIGRPQRSSYRCGRRCR
jgi:hypothetical protein